MDVVDPADAWLNELAADLPLHAEVLRRLQREGAQEERIVQVSVGCSIGRGTADALSDLDCEISLDDAAWPDGLALIDPLVHRCGEVVELLHHRLAGVDGEHRRSAVQFASGVQLDLMVWPVSVWSGMRPPDAVVLYARRPVFTTEWDPTRANPTETQVQEWCFLGWWALLDAAKYLRRGSPWEARQRLDVARDSVFRLLAAAHGVPFAEYGITALVDAGITLPGELGETAVNASEDRLVEAVCACSDLLASTWAACGRAPTAMAEWTCQRLRRQLGASR